MQALPIDIIERIAFLVIEAPQQAVDQLGPFLRGELQRFRDNLLSIGRHLRSLRSRSGARQGERVMDSPSLGWMQEPLCAILQRVFVALTVDNPDEARRINRAGRDRRRGGFDRWRVADHLGHPIETQRMPSGSTAERWAGRWASGRATAGKS